MNVRGVVILLSNNIEYKVSHSEGDAIGNMLLLDMIISDIKISLINIYGANTDDCSFAIKLEIFYKIMNKSLLFGVVTSTLYLILT